MPSWSLRLYLAPQAVPNRKLDSRVALSMHDISVGMTCICGNDISVGTTRLDTPTKFALAT